MIARHGDLDTGRASARAGRRRASRRASRRVGRPHGNLRTGPERGSGTVLVLGVVALLLLAATLATALAAVGVARHRAASAADLAALAVAARRADGVAAACTAGSRTARAAGAELARCRLDGDTAEVEATVRPAGWLGGFGQVRAPARAGPVG